MKLILAFILGICLISEAICAISCKNQNNKNVDWFVAFKYPKGYDFVYYSSESKGKEWEKPDFDLSDAKNLIGVTLRQAYKSQGGDSFFAFYNDAAPIFNDLFSSYRGHLKGVVNFDRKSGYWLIHSVPKFPYPEEYHYGSGQAKYGQSFICVSLERSSLDKIAVQLLMMQASVYNYKLREDFAKNPQSQKLLEDLVLNNKVKRRLSQIIKLSTSSGFSVTHFGKSRSFDDDLYYKLVAPTLQKSILVETWIRGKRVPTNCVGEYKVYNIEGVKIKDTPYKETQDHSKWVVDNEGTTFCVGDINRMSSQFTRGGGTLCLQNKFVAGMLLDAVLKYEKCPKSDVKDLIFELNNLYLKDSKGAERSPFNYFL